MSRIIIEYMCVVPPAERLSVRPLSCSCVVVLHWRLHTALLGPNSVNCTKRFAHGHHGHVSFRKRSPWCCGSSEARRVPSQRSVSGPRMGIKPSSRQQTGSTRVYEHQLLHLGARLGEAHFQHRVALTAMYSYVPATPVRRGNGANMPARDFAPPERIWPRARAERTGYRPQLAERDEPLSLRERDAVCGETGSQHTAASLQAPTDPSESGGRGPLRRMRMPARVRTRARAHPALRG